jgi:glycine/D-amino acid oxidase-like deaminating enzyme
VLEAAEVEPMLNSPITKVEHVGGITLVTTPSGPIQADHVVFACDPHAAAKILQAGASTSQELLDTLTGMEYASLPIVLTSLYSSLEIAAYHRADESRLIGQHVPRDGPSIWPVEHADAQQQTVRHPRLVLLLRAPTPARCRARWPGAASEYVQHCLPRWLRQQDYQVETAHDAGYRWTFAVLTQPAQPSSPKIPKSAPKRAD